MRKPITDYVILKALSSEQLVEQVKAALRENKQPFGYPFVVTGTAGSPTYFQAMAFYETGGEPV